MGEGRDEFVFHAVDAFGLAAGGAFSEEEFIAFDLQAEIVGYVAGNFGGADDFTSRVLNGGNGNGEVEEGAIFSHADGLEVVDAFAFFEAFEDGGFFMLTVWRDDDGDGFSDHFGGGVAEDAFSGGVPALDDALEVFGDDGVIGGFDDSTEDAFVVLQVRRAWGGFLRWCFFDVPGMGWDARTRNCNGYGIAIVGCGCKLGSSSRTERPVGLTLHDGDGGEYTSALSVGLLKAHYGCLSDRGSGDSCGG